MTFQVSAEAEKRIEKLKARYPNKKSAVMPILYVVQEEHGCISEEAVQWVSDQVGIAPVHVRELVTFYTMYRSKPLGKYHIQVCRTLACGLCGAKGIMEHLHERLGIEPREVTADGMFSYEYVECLGSCGTGPMCQINDTFFEQLTPSKLEEILVKIEKEKPDLSLSGVRDELGAGLQGYPKSLALQPER